MRSAAGVVSEGAAQPIQVLCLNAMAVIWRLEKSPSLMWWVAAAFRGRHQKGRDANHLEYSWPQRFTLFFFPLSMHVKSISRCTGVKGALVWEAKSSSTPGVVGDTVPNPAGCLYNSGVCSNNGTTGPAEGNKQNTSTIFFAQQQAAFFF